MIKTVAKRVNGKTTYLIFLTVTTAVVAVCQDRAANLNRTPSQLPAQLEQRLAQLPIVDYTEDSESDLVRRRRNDRHNPPVPQNVKVQKLNENMHATVLNLTLSHQPIEPALPIRSDLVVTGIVTNVQAYLSTDRSTLYYETTVSIEEVLKGRERLASGLNITAERRGGAVRFASGKILRRAEEGRYAPIRAHKYLFFLNSIEGDTSFSLVTGYDLVGNEVMPLDGSGEDPYEPYLYYRYKPVSKLLDDLRKALPDDRL